MKAVGSLRRFSSLGTQNIDVIVIGGGHAGCEAAAASARCGASTALLTHKASAIGEMSCNPSFGGIGKGHLLREVDALDGVCPRVCDKSAVTYQALNRGSGPAVLGLRAQIDRKLYKGHMQEEILKKTPNLRVIEGAVEDLLLKDVDGRLHVNGVVLASGEKITSSTVVITTGTFLGGEIFLGAKRWPAGRMGEQSSLGLSKTLRALSLNLGRLRTGTPPRILKHSVDFQQFIHLPADAEPIPFSFMTDQLYIQPEQQLPTYLGYTTEQTREIIVANLHNNEHVREEYLASSGPRYCPSLESKVIRFPELQHRVFLEHEGYDSELIYPQGMSMTFEEDVQLAIMRSIKGLENVEIVQPGYGVQYDFVDPKQLKPTLEVKKVAGLFLAGQINGTTGYEEAAAQGVLAGINAAAKLANSPGMTIPRTLAYLGVLVDDLTSLGTNEPYRMFTSRAECRLHLRPDNADARLTELGHKYGVVSDARWDHYQKSSKLLSDTMSRLQSIELSRAKWSRLVPRLENAKQNGKVLSAFDVMHRHDVTFKELSALFPELADLANLAELEKRIRIEGTYAAQHARMKRRYEEIERESTTQIPDGLSYASMAELSQECAEKLDRFRPATLAAATRIPGITPEAIIVLLRHLRNPKSRTHNVSA